MSNPAKPRITQKAVMDSMVDLRAYLLALSAKNTMPTSDKVIDYMLKREGIIASEAAVHLVNVAGHKFITDVLGDANLLLENRGRSNPNAKQAMDAVKKVLAERSLSLP